MTFGSSFGRVFSPTFQPKSQAAGAVSGFVPTDITGCAVWIDFSDANTLFTDAGSTKVANDDDAIYQANDKSGNNVNAVMSDSLYRPKYKPNIQNSLSAGLSSGSNLLLHNYPLGAATDFTVFAAAKYTSLRDYDGLFGGNWSAYNFHTSSNGTCYAGTNSSNRIVTASGYVEANANIVIALIKSGTSSGNLSLYNNGGAAVVNTGKTAPNPSSASVAIMNYANATSNSLVGYLYEYIVYNTALSDTDRGTVTTYLNTKWSLY